MKLAFFHHTLRLGSGIDTVILEVASRLSNKHDVACFCFFTDRGWMELNPDLNVKEHRLWSTTHPSLSMLSPLLRSRSLRSIKKEFEGYDIINAHHYPANFLAVQARNPVRVIVEWSAAPTSSFKGLTDKSYISLASAANAFAARHADLLLAPCEFVQNWISGHYHLNAHKILLDGVNFQIFNREKVSVDAVYSKYPHLEGKRIVLFVGRLVESKNVHRLIAEFSHLSRKLPDVTLVLIGSSNPGSSYYRFLRTTAKALGDRVVFAGAVPWNILPAFYKICSVYGTCSLWEGFLRAEAFAMAKPMIAFDVSANAETVKDGVNGILINITKREFFAQGLIRLLDDERQARRMGENGYSWAKANLDFDVIAERLDSIFMKATRKNDESIRRSPTFAIN